MCLTVTLETENLPIMQFERMEIVNPNFLYFIRCFMHQSISPNHLSHSACVHGDAVLAGLEHFLLKKHLKESKN